jgi:hypothetical protein
MNIKLCPDGKELNPTTNRCNKLCPHGFLRNDKFQCRKCIKQLPLAERDQYLIQIEAEINNKKRLLVTKKKELDNKHKLNHYLNDVKENYNKYYNYIVKEKQQQYNALLLLKEYMNDLIQTQHLVDEQIRTAKYDQTDILKEIDRVKAELDELIE